MVISGDWMIYLKPIRRLILMQNWANIPKHIYIIQEIRNRKVNYFNMIYLMQGLPPVSPLIMNKLNIKFINNEESFISNTNCFIDKLFRRT